MRKLNGFNKSNKKINIIVTVAFLLTGLILVGVSYAVYQKEDEVRFINAKVGEFETSSSDIELAMTLDGEDIDTPPEKGYYNIIVECDYADGSWDKERWAAIIGNITSNRVKCNVNFKTLDVLTAKVELGDYIKMTPTSTNYTPPLNLTGYTGNQNTLDPSELNLWRVIKKNEDGTVEVVSEYVSSKYVYFYGQAGYMNLVGGLNVIESQYTNEKYVQSTRYMGYSNQTQKCTSLSSCLADTGYQTDVNLVKAAIGNLLVTRPDGAISGYILASRGINSATYFSRGVSGEGSVSAYSHLVSSGNQASFEGAIRPILILKSNNMIISGDGKSEDSAYQLS